MRAAGPGSNGQAMKLSEDQAEAYDRVSDILLSAGVDLPNNGILIDAPKKRGLLGITGKAGSGKTLLLAEIVKALIATGVEAVSADYESRKKDDKRTFAVLAPTNKAASVLRSRGVPATTIHRILYTPVYDPEYEKIAQWLSGEATRPEIEALTEDALDRAEKSFKTYRSMPGALAAAGLRGSDFIAGWTRRDGPLDIGLIDESSMLDDKQFDDLSEIFSTLVLFGDPAQLAPVGQAGAMVFDRLDDTKKMHLDRIHRQEADNPILDLAHALGDPHLTVDDFEGMIEDAARTDDRIVVAPRVSTDIMARSPVLVWRNATRIRLIHAFRSAFGAPADAMIPGEPLICDGIELPIKHRSKRIDLEARGLIKGAQCVYIGPGRKPGFAKFFVFGADDPQVNAASIIKIESPGEEEPFIASAARMGAAFVHGAACTIHKAQGSQWPQVQVFGPDIRAAADFGREEAGLPLWKRLAYVAVTRAETRLHWVTRYRMAKPKGELSAEDVLSAPAAPLVMAQEEAD